MDTFLVNISRLMFATLLVFGAFRLSESYSITKKPARIVRVVEGESKQLVWNVQSSASEYFVTFSRLKKGETNVEQIASRTKNSAFTTKEKFKNEYKASLPATLLLMNVKRDEEYDYTIRMLDSSAGEQTKDQVTVEVVVPPKITEPPVEKLTIRIGRNYTLTCNASGDPHPNITWTKAGVPKNQFNASGNRLHLVTVQRTDAGSYMCTVSNGYGENITKYSTVDVECGSNICEPKTVGIEITSEVWKQAYGNKESVEFKDLQSKLLSEIWSVYTKNPAKQLYRATVDGFRPGSVFATIELLFGKSASKPLEPLEKEMEDRNLGDFRVDPVLVLDPTTPPTTSPTDATTTRPVTTEETGTDSGLTTSEMWGIIGGCIAFVLLIVIVILICCICKKRKSGGGASKGKSYSEADGYRMNRQQPPSGLGTASPAYVEASKYAVPNSRKQDDESKPPLNYADLSFNNSTNRQPPPRYNGTEYSETSPPEKRPPPAGGQQGEGGGFELWC